MPGTYRSGGRPTPTATKRLRGSRVRGRENEPQYEAGEPECPDHVRIDPLAAEVWNAMAARLLASHVLTTAHGELLAMLAHSVADYRRARAQFRVMNYQQVIVEEFPGSDGKIRRRLRENPLIRRSERLALLVGRLLGEFGLTPVTAPRVQAQRESSSVDLFDVFLGGKPKR